MATADFVITDLRPHATPLLNPTHRHNWPPRPDSAASFDIWIATTREQLLTWLREAAARARHADTAELVRQHDSFLDASWSEFSDHTDIQTGELYGAAARVTRASAAILRFDPQQNRRQDIHINHMTWHRHAEHRFAQAAWEDFLYYQNVWNRKNFDPDKTNYLPEGKRATQVDTVRKDAAAADRSERDADTARKGDNPPAETWELRTQEYPNGAFRGPYDTWLKNMIELYKENRLGYRKVLQLNAVIDPRNAHLYSQPPRGTIKGTTNEGRSRFDHLELQFPREKEDPPIDGEIEESYTATAVAGGQKVPITWSINPLEDKIVQATADSTFKTKVIDTSKHFKAGQRPTGHVLHHGSLETSFDWPTSFECSDWGDVIAQTIMRRNYVYEDEAQTTIRIDSRPRYKRQTVLKNNVSFQHTIQADGTFGHRLGTGNWDGQYVNSQEDSDQWELDADGARIPLAPTRVFKTEYAVIRVSGPQGPLSRRRHRHEVDGLQDQISDDESEDCISSNLNFVRSGNWKAVDLGTEVPEDFDGLAFEDMGEESDLEGDGFALSYEECSTASRLLREATRLRRTLVEESGENDDFTVNDILNALEKKVPLEDIRTSYQQNLNRADAETIQAQALLDKLIADHGANDAWSREKVLDLQKSGLEDAHITAAYQKSLHPRQQRRDRAQALLDKWRVNIGEIASWGLNDIIQILEKNFSEDAVQRAYQAKYDEEHGIESGGGST